MTSYIERIGFTHREVYSIVMLLIILGGTMVLPPEIWEAWFGVGEKITRDVIREEIEDYIDQGIGGSPFQTEKTATYILGVIDIGGTDHYYVLGGTDGKLDFHTTDADDAFNWAIGNMTRGGSLFVRSGNYTIDNTIVIPSTHSHISIVGEIRGWGQAGSLQRGVWITTDADITMIRGSGIGEAWNQRLDGIELENLYFRGSGLGTTQYLVNFTRVDRLYMDNVLIREANYCFMLRNPQWCDFRKLIIDQYYTIGLHIYRMDGECAQCYFESTVINSAPNDAPHARGIVFDRADPTGNPITDFAFDTTHFALKSPANNQTAIYVKGNGQAKIADHIVFNDIQSEANRLLWIEGRTDNFWLRNGYHSGQNSGLDGIYVDSSLGGGHYKVYVEGFTFSAVTGSVLHADQWHAHIVVTGPCRGVNTITESNNGQVHLPATSAPFVYGVNGTTEMTSKPFGFEIDAVGERAVTFVKIPEGWQHIHVLTVYGVALIQDPQGMMLNITVYAVYKNSGVPNYIAAANKASHTLGSPPRGAAWQITPADDSDFNNIGEEFWLQIVVSYEGAGGGGEAATDAILQSVLVEGM